MNQSKDGRINMTIEESFEGTPISMDLSYSTPSNKSKNGM